jgi:uncharacterized membrane protein
MNERMSQISALENLLARMMLGGVTISAIALTTGLALWLAGQQATRLLDVGLIALIATPLLRVVVSLLEAIRMRDWLFVMATVAVVMLLSTTIMLSFRAAGS